MLHGVVDAAGDQGLVGVAFDEVDHHLLPDARQRDHAPGLAGPLAGHAHPARTLVAMVAQAVPVELHLHAAVLVGVNLLGGGLLVAHHHRGLRARDQRLGRVAVGPEDMGVAHGAEAAAEVRLALARFVARVLRVDVGGDDHVVGVLAGQRVFFQRKAVACGQRAHGGGVARDAQRMGVELLHAHQRQVAPARGLGVQARVVIVLQRGRRPRQRGAAVHLQRRGGLEVVVVGQRHLGRRQLVRVAPFGDGLQVDQLVLRLAVLVLGEAGEVDVRGHAVADDQRVLVGGMAEEVVHAFFLHQPADKVEVGLAVLHAVQPRREAAAQVEHHVAGVLLEHLLDDGLDRHVLEHAAVGAARQQP
jgi:hypothetical protein